MYIMRQIKTPDSIVKYNKHKHNLKTYENIADNKLNVLYRTVQISKTTIGPEIICKIR